MKTAAIIFVSVLMGTGVLLLLIKSIFSRIQNKLAQHIQQNIASEQIIAATTKVNISGLRSKGGKQIRGNGAMVLTRDIVYLIRAIPIKTYQIPINSITQVSLPASFNGRYVLSRLLYIEYKDNSGTDAIACSIQNPKAWKTAIEKQILL